MIINEDNLDNLVNAICCLIDRKIWDREYATSDWQHGTHDEEKHLKESIKDLLLNKQEKGNNENT